MAKKKTHTKVERTSAGLRDAIFDELEALRNGESNPTRANAVAKLASSVVETVRMEIDVQKHMRSTGRLGEGYGGSPVNVADGVCDEKISGTPMGGNLRLTG